MKNISLKLIVIVVLIALLGLLGWYNNWILFSSIKAVYVPIAPMAAILILLTCFAFSSKYIHKPKQFFADTNSIAVTAILLAIFSIVDYFYFLNWDFEKIVFARFNQEGITGEISPLAASLIIMANSSFLLIKNSTTARFIFLTKLLIYLQLLFTIFFILAYVENYDDIYINDIFSLAIPTAFCLFLLSLVQLQWIQFNLWPLSYFSSKNPSNRIVSSLLPVFLLYFLVYQFYNHHLDLLTSYQYAHLVFLVVGLIGFYVISVLVTKNIQKELDESKSLYESLFNNATVGLYQSTPKGKVISANDTLVKMLQYNSLKELLSIDITKGSYKDFAKRGEFIDKMIAFGEVKGFESEWITKNGDVIYVTEGARAVRDENGEIIRFDGVVEDITQRKLNELSLLKMSKAIDNSSDVIFMTDANGVFTYVNPEFTKLYGYTADELIGKHTPRILKSGLQSSELYKKFWNTLQHKQNIKNYHFINKKKSGELINVDISVDPILDENDSIIGYMGIQRDITERVRNEKIQQIVANISNASHTISDLKEIIKFIQKELSNLLNTKNFCVALYNESDDTIDRIFYEDEKDNILNFPAGKTFTGMVIKDSKSYLIKEAETRKLAQEKAIDVVGVISKVWLGVPLILNGKSRGAIVVQSYEDENAFTNNDIEVLENIANQIGIIIERVFQENQIKIARDKAEENNRLKAMFLANLSHEIRTPMNAILGFSDLLIDKAISEEKQVKYHEIINSSGKRLMNLINDIVDISKIDANEMRLETSEFNLNKLIDQLEHQFMISPKNLNTTIKSHKHLKDTDSYVCTDETRLSQVLSNLLENALKFTHNGTVEFGYQLEKEVLHFFVKDSGVGINKKDQQLIFERFGQSDNEIKKVKQGSGLGLSISKGIVELFGGTIWVESEPHKGSTFHFTIPSSVVKRAEIIKETEQQFDIVGSSIKNILIAEDEETNFYFIEAALEDQGFNLIHVENGKLAVDTFYSNQNIDIILMDFNMPVMNGMDATIEIRKTNQTIPIIAFTAYALMADREKALEIGCTDYLSKPVSKVDLLKMITKYSG